MGDSKYPADWNKRRITLFNRHDWECQNCNDHVPRDSGRELHAHHIRPISEGGGHSLDNLLPLCEECHTDIHASDLETDLDPERRVSCAYCGLTYRKDWGTKGSFCSEDCWLAKRAEKKLNYINSNARICSSLSRPMFDLSTILLSCGFTE